MRVIAYAAADDSSDSNWTLIEKPVEIKRTERYADGAYCRNCNWKATFSINGKNKTVYFNLSRLS